MTNLAGERPSSTSWSRAALRPAGGWGVAYHEDDPPQPDLDAYVRFVAQGVTEGCRRRGLMLPALHLEPGRSLVARGGVAVYTVGAVKQTATRRRLFIDGGVAGNTRQPRRDLALAAAAGGMKIALIDVKGPQDMGKAVGALMSQKPHVLVLIPGDRVTGDGQPGATFLIQRMAAQHVPTIATTEAGAKQGAVFAAGPGTGGKVLVNPKSATVAGVTVPEGGTPVS